MVATRPAAAPTASPPQKTHQQCVSSVSTAGHHGRGRGGQMLVDPSPLKSGMINTIIEFYATQNLFNAHRILLVRKRFEKHIKSTFKQFNEILKNEVLKNEVLKNNSEQVRFCFSQKPGKSRHFHQKMDSFKSDGKGRHRRFVCNLFLHSKGGIIAG
jgi:hypothetical protein